MKFFSSDAANLMLAAMIKVIAIPDASWYFHSPRKRGFFHSAENLCTGAGIPQIQTL